MTVDTWQWLVIGALGFVNIVLWWVIVTVLNSLCSIETREITALRHEWDLWREMQKERSHDR